MPTLHLSDKSQETAVFSGHQKLTSAMSNSSLNNIVLCIIRDFPFFGSVYLHVQELMVKKNF